MVQACCYYDSNQILKFQGTSDCTFTTHLHPALEFLHTLSETILLPARYNLQALARMIEPLPGEDKDQIWKGLAVRVGSFVLSLLLLPFSLISTAIGLPLRFIDHLGRKEMSYYEGKENPPEPPLVDQAHPLKIRTHNLGLVPTTMSISNDLRCPLERANEIANGILSDPLRPDVIFFEETFHEDASSALFEKLKGEYPYVLYNVAPQITGFTSGAMVFSKYPLGDIEFRVFDHMLGPEKVSARGMLRVSIHSDRGKLFLYQIHTQALLGEGRAQARKKQLQDIRSFMREDIEHCRGQVLVGDLNTSHVSAWGHDNQDQSERATLDALQELFDDPFLEDHNVIGNRTQGRPFYLYDDNQFMNQGLAEPSGSWYVGPYANPGFLMSEFMRRDREAHGYPEPRKIQEIQLENSPSWGTSTWHGSQPANTARFDYILFPKNDRRLDGRVEIRRVRLPQNAQSSPSDHLPVDGRIWFR